MLGYSQILTQLLSPEYPFLFDQRKGRPMYIVHINAMQIVDPVLKCNFTRDVHKHVLP